MKNAREFRKITKYNLLQYYHNARERAFSASTIRTAFRKTGIWPFNPSVIEDEAFEPAKNTTTQSAQPVPATLSTLLVPTPVNMLPTRPNSPTETANSSTPSPAYSLANLPHPLHPRASREALLVNNRELYGFAEQCRAQMEADYASMKLKNSVSVEQGHGT